jgi:DNA polymerase-3 subunit alpha
MLLRDVGAAPVPAAQPAQKKPQTLYVKLPSVESREFRKLRPILHMFPGDSKLVLYFADTKKRMGGTCLLHELLLQELKELLGQDSVVLK